MLQETLKFYCNRETFSHNETWTYHHTRSVCMSIVFLLPPCLRATGHYFKVIYGKKQFASPYRLELTFERSKGRNGRRILKQISQTDVVCQFTHRHRYHRRMWFASSLTDAGLGSFLLHLRTVYKRNNTTHNGLSTYISINNQNDHHCFHPSTTFSLNIIHNSVLDVCRGIIPLCTKCRVLSKHEWVMCLLSNHRTL